MVTRFATMLLSSTLGHHVGVAHSVGEAPTDTEAAVVGEGAAQGRATRTGHRTGLTLRLTHGRANARTEAPQRRSNGNAATDRGVDTAGPRASPSVAERSSAGERGHITKIGTAADGERRAGISRHNASHQSDERNTHQQLLHCNFSFFSVSATASAGRVMPPCERFHHSPSPSSSIEWWTV